MSSCVLYVDEAGSPNAHQVPLREGTSPMLVLGGLALPLSDWRAMDREYLRLKWRFFENEMRATKQDRPEHWEITDLTAPRNRNSDRRHEFLNRVLNLLEGFRARVFGVVFVKDPDQPSSPVGLYTSAVQQLADRFNAYVSEHEDFAQGIMIMDGRAKERAARQDFQVAASYLSYVFGSETGRELTRLAEAPLFADSRLTAGLQIAHHIAGLIYATQFHYYLRYLPVQSRPDGYDYSYLQRFWPQLKALEFRSRTLYNDYPLYGLRVNGTQELKNRWRRPPVPAGG